MEGTKKDSSISLDYATLSKQINDHLKSATTPQASAAIAPKLLFRLKRAQEEQPDIDFSQLKNKITQSVQQPQEEKELEHENIIDAAKTLELLAESDSSSQHSGQIQIVDDQQDQGWASDTSLDISIGEISEMPKEELKDSQSTHSRSLQEEQTFDDYIISLASIAQTGKMQVQIVQERNVEESPCDESAESEDQEIEYQIDSTDVKPRPSSLLGALTQAAVQTAVVFANNVAPEQERPQSPQIKQSQTSASQNQKAISKENLQQKYKEEDIFLKEFYKKAKEYEHENKPQVGSVNWDQEQKDEMEEQGKVEDDMLRIANGMKQHAVNFQSQFKEDEDVIKNIGDKQDENIDKTDSNVKKLQQEQSVAITGMFTKIIMMVSVLAVFAAMVVFIKLFPNKTYK